LSRPKEGVGDIPEQIPHDRPGETNHRIPAPKAKADKCQMSDSTVNPLRGRGEALLAVPDGASRLA